MNLYKSLALAFASSALIVTPSRPHPIPPVPTPRLHPKVKSGGDELPVCWLEGEELTKCWGSCTIALLAFMADPSCISQLQQILSS